MENTPELETRRLHLRRFTRLDIPAIYAILGDEEVTRFVPWRLESMEQAEKYYREHYEKLYSQRSGCAYAVCLKETGEVIGYVHCPMKPPYDFGYGYKKEYWGQGYASEAARAVVAWLKEAGQPYITATHDVENPHSGWVMQAAGMKYQYTYHELCVANGKWVWFRMYQLNLNGEHPAYMGYWEKYLEHKIEEMGDES